MPTAKAFELETQTQIAQEDEEKENGCRSQCVNCFDSFFYNLGVNIAHHPMKVLIISTFVCFILSTCYFTLVRTENRPEKLWVPEDTQSNDDFKYLKTNWPRDEVVTDYIIFENKGNHENGLLNSNAIQEMLRLHELILSANTTAGKYKTYYKGYANWETKCARKGEVCWRVNLLDIFDQFNETLINEMTDAEVLTRTNTQSFWRDNTNELFSQTAVLGGLEGEKFQTDITKIDAIMASYYFQLDEYTADGEREDYALESLEGDFIDLLEDFESEHLVIRWWLQRTWGDEFSELLGADIFKIAMAYFILFGYAAINLGRFHCIESSVGLSIGTILSVMFAVYTSMGILALADVMYTPLNTALTFLLLGLGVDDAFVIVQEYKIQLKLLKDQGTKGKEIDVPELIGKTMQSAGQSILVTSLTDFLVFMLGSMTILPALSSFCMYAGVGVLFDFLFQITFFTSCLVLNHDRVYANRRDICGCFCKVPEESDGDCVCCPGPKQTSYLEIFYEKLGEIIEKKPVAIGGVILMFLLFGLGINGIFVREAEFDTTLFLDQDGDAIKFLDTQEHYFDAPDSIGIYVKDIDYFARQTDMKNLHQEIFTNDKFDLKWGLEDWHQEYLRWANAGNVENQYLTNGVGTIANPSIISDETVYYNSLQTFLQGSGSEFSENIVFEENSLTDVKTSVIMTFLKAELLQQDGMDRYDTMEELRDEISNIISEAFPYFSEFIYWEEFGVIKTEFIRNVCIAMGVIAVVTISLISELITAACVMFSISFAVVDVAGFSYYWGLDYNGIVMIYSLIALGLTVDYAIHVGYKYSVVSGSRSERMKISLKEMGPAVHHGVTSTFLAVLVLANSSTYIFGVFFKMFILATTLGGLHGLFILPCLLTLFGPEKEATISKNKDQAI